MNPASSTGKSRTGSVITLAMAVLCAVTAAVYAVCYGNQERFMSWPAFVLLLAAAAVGTVLTLFAKQYELAAACMAVGSFVALMLFIRIIYMYVVVVVVGIDLKSLDPRFIFSVVFFVVCFVANLVSVFLPQVTNKEGMDK